jgi:hypothetical protein
MTGAPSILADLLADCEAHGIRLALAGDGGLTIDAPQDALTPDLLELLKAHKVELLTILRTRQDFDVDDAPDAEPALAVQAEPAKTACRCGSTTWRDVPIHDGQSIRRDCGRCGRYIGFPIWYGKDTGQNGQHPV